MEFENDMCYLYADAMSCDAQIGLAKKEVESNTYLLNHSINHPSCNRFNEILDKGQEYGLIKSQQTGLKFCYIKPKDDANAPWEQQFASLLNTTTFDQWTKARNTLPPNCASY